MYRTFTPTNTPAIKKMFVSAINTAYDQKLSIYSELYPVKCGFPKIPMNIPYVIMEIMPEIRRTVNSETI